MARVGAGGQGHAKGWAGGASACHSPVHHDAKGARHTKKSHALRCAPGSAPSGGQARPERLTDLAIGGGRGARESPRRRDVGHTLRRRGWRRGNRPRKPSVRSPGRDWATCRAWHRYQVSGQAWGERRWEGWGKHWPAPRRSRLLPTVRREEHVDHASPMCGRMARATRPIMRGTGAGDGGSRGAGAGGKLGASGGRVTGRSPGCEQAA